MSAHSSPTATPQGNHAYDASSDRQQVAGFLHRLFGAASDDETAIVGVTISPPFGSAAPCMFGSGMPLAFGSGGQPMFGGPREQWLRPSSVSSIGNNTNSQQASSQATPSTNNTSTTSVPDTPVADRSSEKRTTPDSPTSRKLAQDDDELNALVTQQHALVDRITMVCGALEFADTFDVSIVKRCSKELSKLRNDMRKTINQVRSVAIRRTRIADATKRVTHASALPTSTSQ